MTFFAWISQADAKALVVGLGILFGSLTAVVVFFRQPVIARPLGWVGRKLGIVGHLLIGDPIACTLRRVLDQWADEHIRPSIAAIASDLAEVKTQIVYNNGGSSLKDGQDAIAEAVGLPPRPKVYPPPPDAE